jgi:hypothetical protein
VTFFWRELSPVEIIGLAAALIALIGMVLALLTPAGRDAFGKLGLRIADALTSWLERMLSAQSREARQIERGLKQ